MNQKNNQKQDFVIIGMGTNPDILDLISARFTLDMSVSINAVTPFCTGTTNIIPRKICVLANPATLFTFDPVSILKPFPQMKLLEKPYSSVISLKTSSERGVCFDINKHLTTNPQSIANPYQRLDCKPKKYNRNSL